jgi:two-component system, cell cycle response regulator DivK
VGSPIVPSVGPQPMPKILIVEDNEDNWQILSRRLRRRGYDVVIARDGKQGLTMAKSDKPDLILMDMNLPLLDGWRRRG